MDNRCKKAPDRRFPAPTRTDQDDVGSFASAQELQSEGYVIEVALPRPSFTRLSKFIKALRSIRIMPKIRRNRKFIIAT